MTANPPRLLKLPQALWNQYLVAWSLKKSRTIIVGPLDSLIIWSPARIQILPSQFLNSPGQEHELAFMHVLCYLRGTSTWAITVGRVGDNSVISAFCDSDWGSNYDSRSFSGSCLFLHGPVGWKTSKQEVVSLSSTEADANLFCDNQGALGLLKNPLYQHRTRHIKLSLHWCRQILDEGTIRVLYIPSRDMLADLLTKDLPKATNAAH
ncbi:hypothetical protein O181_013499 [Austropuccinia psidii MF-1]|uniref:Uncharacterized protein n=1 Tax=Austropuccinia psidii MF-1 TaxID=1389203 RepID=A0A9Q3GNX4_9BASI|nr:hypothetical protein [Austropuccinia psidii MF-1]